MNDTSETVVTQNHLRRKAAVIGNIKKRFLAGYCKVYILLCSMKDNFSTIHN